MTPSEPVGGVPMGLLQELLWTYGPCGQEDAVRAVCHRELRAVTDETWADAAGNLVGLIRGHADSPATRVLAHMDELSMLVKRVEPDGTLHLSPLGTMYPANFGLGPVAILGDRETVCGVLPLGSEHTTKESRLIWETKPDQSELTMALEVGPTESEYATRVGGGPIVGYGDARSAIPAITSSWSSSCCVGDRYWLIAGMRAAWDEPAALDANSHCAAQVSMRSIGVVEPVIPAAVPTVYIACAG